ncbi:hypothetical protein KYC_19949 [Achromobacter arsenitoxydans SY8]|uniref:Uncharacterized protein n=1 Tax=Achromobacter arsenitoxydans SY8 TaxID=477184 RepID=H0FB33_9BURK|nr:hypothetical protein KYC_19949 [Achromobacter arsenitoxydans SY8]
MRLREENRALRALLAAQVQATLPQQPGWFRRLCWGLISAPGAALVGWRSLMGRDAETPLTRRRVGSATLTVLYTLAIYGALVLLVVSWNSPNTTISGATAAGPVRVPLVPAPALPPGADPGPQQPAAPVSEPAAPEASEPDHIPSAPQPEQPQPEQPATAAPPESQAPAAAPAAATPAAISTARTPAADARADAGPHSTLRITEIAAPDPLAWVGALREELARCAETGFFERPECAWTARRQFCEPNQGWGVVKECPAQP